MVGALLLKAELFMLHLRSLVLLSLCATLVGCQAKAPEAQGSTVVDTVAPQAKALEPARQMNIHKQMFINIALFMHMRSSRRGK